MPSILSIWVELLVAFQSHAGMTVMANVLFVMLVFGPRIYDAVLDASGILNYTTFEHNLMTA